MKAYHFTIHTYQGECKDWAEHVDAFPFDTLGGAIMAAQAVVRFMDTDASQTIQVKDQNEKPVWHSVVRKDT